VWESAFDGLPATDFCSSDSNRICPLVSVSTHYRQYVLLICKGTKTWPLRVWEEAILGACEYGTGSMEPVKRVRKEGTLATLALGYASAINDELNLPELYDWAKLDPASKWALEKAKRIGGEVLDGPITSFADWSKQLYKDGLDAAGRITKTRIPLLDDLEEAVKSTYQDVKAVSVRSRERVRSVFVATDEDAATLAANLREDTKDLLMNARVSTKQVLAKTKEDVEHISEVLHDQGLSKELVTQGWKSLDETRILVVDGLSHVWRNVPWFYDQTKEELNKFVYHAPQVADKVVDVMLTPTKKLIQAYSDAGLYKVFDYFDQVLMSVRRFFVGEEAVPYVNRWFVLPSFSGLFGRVESFWVSVFSAVVGGIIVVGFLSVPTLVTDFLRSFGLVT
jgi:hypothetical protein